MEKLARTYRLPKETVGQIEKIASDERCTATDAVIRAIAEYCNTETQCNASDNATNHVLAGQLEVKDKQIFALQAQLSDITKALLAAQDTAKAAQLLHAADKPELVPTEAEREELAKKKPWWKFWKG